MPSYSTLAIFYYGMSLGAAIVLSLSNTILSFLLVVGTFGLALHFHAIARGNSVHRNLVDRVKRSLGFEAKSVKSGPQVKVRGGR